MMHPAPHTETVKVSGQAEALGAAAAMLGFNLFRINSVRAGAAACRA